MKLNEKIILCRKKCGISQEALGDMVGVSRQAVSKWETGDALPEVTKLKALADVFGGDGRLSSERRRRKR